MAFRPPAHRPVEGRCWSLLRKLQRSLKVGPGRFSGDQCIPQVFAYASFHSLLPGRNSQACSALRHGCIAGQRRLMRVRTEVRRQTENRRAGVRARGVRRRFRPAVRAGRCRRRAGPEPPCRNARGKGYFLSSRQRIAQVGLQQSSPRRDAGRAVQPGAAGYQLVGVLVELPRRVVMMRRGSQ